MMCSALTRLNDEFDIERIVVSTYQAVSGAGVAGMEELYRQSQEVLDGKEPVAKTLPCAGRLKNIFQLLSTVFLKLINLIYQMDIVKKK